MIFFSSSVEGGKIPPYTFLLPPPPTPFRLPTPSQLPSDSLPLSSRQFDSHSCDGNGSDGENIIYQFSLK